MRYAINFIGSEAVRNRPVPELVLLNDEPVRHKNWFASTRQEVPNPLLDDVQSAMLRLIRAALLAYQFYLFVHNTRLWSGKRPLILIRERSLANRVAAYAGSWGGGDVVKADLGNVRPFGPIRYVLEDDGSLSLWTR